MQPSRQDIENAARLVPERMAPEFGDGMAWNEYRDDARPWQPWADTEAGRSDARVLLAAVLKWFSAMDSVDYMKWPRAAFDVELLLQEMGDKENLFEVQAATFAAAIAIGQHMEQSNER